MTGLSGAGKTTISILTQKLLEERGFAVEVIDGDEYRKILYPDLGYSKADRNENIRRLGFVGTVLARKGVIAIMATINPYEEMREELKSQSHLVRTVWVKCNLETLFLRDTKGLYKRSQLPDSDPNKIKNLTGVNDPFETPSDADLILHSDAEIPEESAEKLLNFILSEIKIL